MEVLEYCWFGLNENEVGICVWNLGLFVKIIS